jgi:hypothetical protein
MVGVLLGAHASLEAQQYMRSYQAHQLLSLTLSNYSSISGNCTGISTANQRSLYTFETV